MTKPDLTPAAKPLAGVRVLDFSALGPGPFASMMLADFGAEVLAVRRPGGLSIDPSAGMARGKDILQLDLSRDEARALAARLAKGVDVVLESSRPGVMERLGLGPEVLMSANPALIYARLTGWGQSGAYARRAGHDINYLAISGALGVCGAGKPAAPPALLGDLANGSYIAVIGIVMALFERNRTGLGRVVDAAIVDGAAYMLTALFAERGLGFWSGDISEHLLSGQAPFYGTYECADGRWFAVGAIETKFYDQFLAGLGLDDVPRGFAEQMDRAAWPALRARVAERFRNQPRDAWTAVFDSRDACATPVLDLDELADDPHMVSRGTVARSGASWASAAAPRLDGGPSQGAAPTGPRHRPFDIVLREHGLSDAEIAALIATGVLGDT
jgi:alpha-methylacyl-CoA racemase